MIKDILYIIRFIVPEWWQKQKRLKLRRNNSWRSYLSLTVHFHQISQDKYVKEAQDGSI